MDDSRDYFGCTADDAEPTLVLLDAHLLFTRPPADAPTLVEVVEQICTDDSDPTPPFGIARPLHLVKL